jgi:hypothetical protein
VFFAAVGQHSGSTPGSSASEVSLVPEHSLCLVDPAGARIHFRISVSNVGTGSQTVYVTAVAALLRQLGQRLVC